MSQFWKKALRIFTTEPFENKPLNEEDIVYETVTRLQRRMISGNWQFQWKKAASKQIIAVHQNLPELIEIIRITRASIKTKTAIPVKAKMSKTNQHGMVVTSLEKYLANSEGLYLEPASLIRAFINESQQLCIVIADQRKERPILGESSAGQCTYLFTEIKQVVHLFS